MKKYLLTLVLFAGVGMSWQVWDGSKLIVRSTEDPNSVVCYEGKAEDYNGKCTSPEAPSAAYILKKAKEAAAQQ